VVTRSLTTEDTEDTEDTEIEGATLCQSEPHSTREPFPFVTA
jgi:hypothetical protein